MLCHSYSYSSHAECHEIHGSQERTDLQFKDVARNCSQHFCAIPRGAIVAKSVRRPAVKSPPYGMATRHEIVAMVCVTRSSIAAGASDDFGQSIKPMIFTLLCKR